MKVVQLVISVLFVLVTFPSCSQGKIDSVFKSSFDVLYNEDSSIYDSQGDTLCIYFEKRFMRLDFFENVTGIFLERKIGVGANGMARVESIEVFKKWELWYEQEKSTLMWVDDTMDLQLPDDFASSCFNYVDNYPNQIRFKDDPDKIPYNPKVYNYEVKK